MTILHEAPIDETGGKAQLQVRNGVFFVKIINPITNYDVSQKLEAATTRQAIKQWHDFLRAVA